MVADQGRGISPVDLPHVFERFYRSSESRTMPGSGLGPVDRQAVADRHGGSVTRPGTTPGRRRGVLVHASPARMAPPEVLARSSRALQARLSG